MKWRIYKFIFFIAISFILAIFCSNSALAATVNYYVDPTGTDDGSHGLGTGTDAWATIQYAVTNVANPTSDTIIINIAAGTYTTNNDDINIDRGFTDLTMQGASASTTIVQSHTDPDSSTVRVFYVGSGEYVSFEDMTIRYGRSNTNGAAIYQSTSGLLTVKDCIIYDNDGTGDNDSGGIYFDTNSVFEDTTFYGNEGDYVGALFASRSTLTVEITNCTFFDNVGSVGSIYFNGVASTITNTLMTQGDAILLQGDDTHYFKNNVIVDSAQGYDIEYYNFSGSITGSYNIIGNEESNSFFTHGENNNSVNDDYTLSGLSIKAAISENNATNNVPTLGVSSGSAVIDGGDSAAHNGVTPPATDQRGEARYNVTYDIGPYEYQGSDDVDPLISSITDIDEGNSYVTLTFDEGVYDTDGGSGALETTDLAITNFTTNGGGASGASISSVTKTNDAALVGGETEVKINVSLTGTSNGVETFTVSPANGASIYDAAGNAASGTWQESDAITLNGHFDYYVRTDGDDANDGSANDADNAWLTIQHAVDTVLYPTTAPTIINIGSGSYILNNDDISIDRNFTELTLQGAGAGSTIIQPHADPDSATNRNIYIGADENVTVSDMTIQYGQLSSGTGPGIYFYSGNFTINDCVINDNDSTVSSGSAGVYVSGGYSTTDNIVVTNSTFMNNDGDHYGGFYYGSYGDNIQLTNSTFYNNTGDYGGGFFSVGNAVTVTNCTFYKGGGTYGGNLYLQTGSASIKNTIMADADQGPDFDTYNSPTVTNNGYNLVETGYSGYFTNGVSGCITGDQASLNMKASPSINNATNNTQTVALLSGSVAINAANDTANNGVSIPTTDQRGLSRNSTTDIGSYEAQASDKADPLVSTFSPVDDATGVATTSNFVLTFDENVDVETGNILIYKSDDTLLETVDITSGKVTGTGTDTITINPTANLAQETDYYIQIAATALDDAASNSYMGINDEFSWSFTSADETNPGLSTLSPANDATNIATDSNLVITFNEIVDAETGYIKLYKEVGDVLIQSFDVTSDISGTGTDTITANPTADLLEETEYYIQIDATAFDDTSSNSYAGISDETSWDFTTGDYSNPTVSTLSPANDATDIAVDANLIITFDEIVAADSGDITLYKYDGTEVQAFDVTSEISGSGTDTITANPTSNLQALTEYYVQIDASAFNDDSANANSYAGIADETTWDFTTAGTAGVTASAISGNTTEAGGTATFTVVLDTEPTENVTVPVSSSDTGEGTVSAASLTFTSGNWDTPQTITMTGVDDDLEDGNIVYTAVLAATTSSDGNYNGINPSDVTITNTDNDTAGVTLSETTQAVTEGGTTDTYTVVLDSEPTSDVVITITDTSDEITASPETLTFTSSDWDTPQTITVTAVNDDIDENSENDTLTSSATSSDGNYNGISIGSVTVTVTDNDTAGVTLSESTQAVTEGGTTDTYTVVLDSEPTSDVVITITDTSDEITASPATLTFTSGNWDTAQTVTITAVNDDVDETGEGDTITASAASSDGNYNGISIGSVTVTVTDNDTAGVTLSESTQAVTEGGATDAYTVVLDSEPTSDVVITVTDSNDGVTVSPSTFTFTSANWDTAQTVTVTAVNDDIDETGEGDTITASAASSDGNYNGISIGSVTVTVTDNDTAGITISLAEITLSEGENGQTFTMILNSEPTAEVTIAINSVIGEVSISDQDIIFNAENWNILQSVTVQAIDDDDVEQLQDETIYYTVSSADTNYNDYALDNLIVSIIDNDNDEEDANNNEIPDIYEDVDPTDEEAVADAVDEIESDTNGDIKVTYDNGTTATIDIFKGTTKKKVKIKRINDTGYIGVVHALGKQVKVVNVLNGEVISSKKLSKKKWTKGVSLKMFKLRKKSCLVITAKNKKNKINLAVVSLKNNYKLGKKSSKTFTSKKAQVSKTKKKKNTILIKSKKNKVLEKYSYTKKKKLKKL